MDTIGQEPCAKLSGKTSMMPGPMGVALAPEPPGASFKKKARGLRSGEPARLQFA